MIIENFERLVATLNDKKEYAKHIRNLKQALNDGLVLKIVYRIIKFFETLLAIQIKKIKYT